MGLEDVRLGVLALADTVAARMRRHGLKCSTVQVIIKNPNLKIISRQRTLPSPTHLAKVLGDTALEIIQSSWNLKAPIRMLSITGSNLVPAEDAGEQLSLFDNQAEILEKQEHLESTLDSIRGRFGKNAISIAGVLNNDIGLDKPNEKNS